MAAAAAASLIGSHSSVLLLHPKLHCRIGFSLRKPLLLPRCAAIKSSVNINTNLGPRVLPAPPLPQLPIGSLLAGPARILATLLSVSLTFSGLILKLLPNLRPAPLPQSLLNSAGPLFFAALRDRPSGYLNTPLTVVAAGLAKWLDIYSGVLMVRVLLSWFPNIPWDRQPLSAIRDLCDPYLNLFRNIIPPIFDTLDVSPLLAFAVLGTLGSILNSSGRM